jgi:hypothetical protein
MSIQDFTKNQLMSWSDNKKNNYLKMDIICSNYVIYIHDKNS